MRIPYVHGKEIPSFESLFLATKEAYAEQGIDIRYETRVASLDLNAGTVAVDGQGDLGYDRLVVATGFDYADPGVPGTDLAGLYYVKNIRRAMEWDKVLDSVKVAVVVEATPLGLEMVTALAHRGIETHLIDHRPWALSDLADPDIAQPVEDSWTEMGVKMHYGVTLEEFTGDGRIRAVRTSDGELPADLAVICTKKVPNTALGTAAGLKTGPTGGFVVDNRMRTSADGVFACGDCVEVPLGVGNLPVQGCPVRMPTPRERWPGSTPAAEPASTNRSTSRGDGGRAVDDRRRGLRRDGGQGARHPARDGRRPGHLPSPLLPRRQDDQGELLAEPDSRRLIGAQMVGQEGIKERRLPRHGRQDGHHHRGPRLHGERVLASDRGAQRTDRPRGPEPPRQPAMKFVRWLRSNSEHYLLMAAQQVAARYGRPCARPKEGVKAWFF